MTIEIIDVPVPDAWDDDSEGARRLRTLVDVRNAVVADSWGGDESHAFSYREAWGQWRGQVGESDDLRTIALLDGGSRRFTELQRMIDGISQRMLSVTLRQLERDGLVRRTVYPVVPPRVDYELTELGRSLREPVKALGDWAIEHIDCIRSAQQRFDREHDPVN